jgi:trigger factor
VKSAVETLNPTRVRLTVEVPFEELKDSLDAAYKKINQQVTVKGFRKGKIPARVIDQRFGRGAVLEEAVNDALPKLYTEAVNEAELNPLGQPEVDITELKDGETLAFTAEVDIRPEIQIPDYSGIEVTVDAVEVTDEDVEKSVEQLRERFASTNPVERAAAEGKDAEVTVKVTAVAARELPELDDDFAQMASEFDTLDELKADSRKRLENMKQYDQATQAQERVLDELLKLAEVPIPEKLLEDEVKTRKHNLEHHQLGQMGLDLAKYLEIQGKTEEEFDAETKEQAVKGIKTQFILDELVNKEKLNVNQEELTEHLMRRAQSSGMSPDQFAQAVVEGGQVPMLVGEVARGKALAVVVEAAKVVDTNGEIVDLEDEEDEAEATEAAPETAEATAEGEAEEKNEA